MLRKVLVASFLAIFIPSSGGAMTLQQVVAEGDQPLPGFQTTQTGPDGLFGTSDDVVEPVTFTQLGGSSMAPDGGFVFRLTGTQNQLVDLGGFVTATTQLRDVYVGDVGSGLELLFEDEQPIGNLTFRGLGTPRLNSAGDLAFLSYAPGIFDPDTRTVSEAIVLNGAPIQIKGGAVPSGLGATSGWDSIGLRALLNDGDAVIQGTYFDGGTGTLNSPGDPDDGETGPTLSSAVLRYDAQTQTYTRLTGTGQVVTNPLGTGDFTIGPAEIQIGDFEETVNPLSSVALSPDGENLVYGFDDNPQSFNIQAQPDATTVQAVYGNTAARFVDGSLFREDTVAPTRIGGDGQTVITSVGSFDVNNDGFWLARVDLGTFSDNNNDEALIVNGARAFGEGDTVPIAASLGGGEKTLSGILHHATFNADGDLAFQVDDVIVLNGLAIVLEGLTPVNDPNTQVSGTLTQINLVDFKMTDRDENGDVTILLHGRQDGEGSTQDRLFTVTVTPQALIQGDYSYDRVVDDTDIDVLFDYLGVDGFDLDGDDDADFNDVDYLVRTVLGTEFGDANLDGFVDTVDLTLLAASYDQTGGWANGDFTGDGLIDLLDLTVLGGAFGFSAEVFGAIAEAALAGDQATVQRLYAAAVPEPSTAMVSVLLVSGVCLCRRRRVVIASTRTSQRSCVLS